MKTNTLPFILFVLALMLSACNGAENSQASTLTFSGFISSREVRIAPEIGGTVADVPVAEGQTVQSGALLLRMQGDVAQAQLEQAQAGVEAAKAAVAAAEAQYAAAQVQYDLVLQGAQLQNAQARASAWQVPADESSELPVWYFQKDEQIAALQNEVQEASDNLDTQLADLEETLSKASSKSFVQVEQRVSRAEAALAVARLTLQQAQAAQENEKVLNAAEQAFNSAEAELKSAQSEYNRYLTESAAQDVLEARAKVAVARSRLQTAQDQLSLLQTGEQSLQVRAAGSNVQLSQTALQQAQAGLQQAEAGLRLAELQVEKMDVLSPLSGVVLTIHIEPGELLAAGSIAILVADLDEVELTVYVPEEQYGRLQLGQAVSLHSDSFPGQAFIGQVSYISDEAEFTPRNVQTTSGRKTTVYAVKISVPNPDHDLKPGMPVDAEFTFE